MDDQFYLQDSRDYVGDGLSFWAQGGGYCTDIGRAEIFTRERAIRYHEDRESDVPWPKAYVDGRAHTGVDCQYIREDEAASLMVEGATLVFQIPKKWNGNNVHWLGRYCTPGSNFDNAARVSDPAGVDAAKADGLIPWPLEYIQGKSRRLVNRQDVSIKEALHGSGIRLINPKKSRELMLNCQGCGRFISNRQRFQEDCRNCGADNLP